MSGNKQKRKKISFYDSDSKPNEERTDKTKLHHCSNPAIKDEPKQADEISYMQPEILPIDTMRKLLKMRGASEEIFKAECDTGTRSFIIKLFYKHITPKPQRDYKLNRFGKLLMKMRLRREKGKEKNDWERMVVFETSNSPSKPIHDSSDTYSKNKSTDNTSSCDRLKPIPSSCINLERKTIKLSSSSSAVVTSIAKKDDKISSGKKLKLDVSPESKIKLCSGVSEDVEPGSGRKIKISRNSPVIEDFIMDRKLKISHKKSLEKVEPTIESKISTSSPVKEESTKYRTIKLSSHGSSVKRESDSSIPDAKKKKAIGWP